MFIYSLRANTLKFFGVTTLAVAALVTLLFFIPTSEPAISENVLDVTEHDNVAAVNYDKIKTADDRINFLRQFGWEVESQPTEEVEVTIPAEFDKIYQSYNELQKKQGFDLTKYLKKDVNRYTYKITNYPDYTGDVYANILVYKNKVIGGDVCSADANGFIHGLDRNVTF